MRTRGIQKGEGGRKSRAYFSPGGAGVESTAPNFQRPLRKRVADMKHGFEPRLAGQFSGAGLQKALRPENHDHDVAPDEIRKVQSGLEVDGMQIRLSRDL